MPPTPPDSSLIKLVDHILESAKKADLVLATHDLVSLLVHCTFQDNGFSILGGDGALVPSYWKNYRFAYHHAMHPPSTCHVNCSALGNFMMVSATLQQFDQPEEIPIEELRRRRLQYFGQAATDKASSSEAVSQKKSEAHYSEEVFNKSIKVTDLILSEKGQSYEQAFNSPESVIRSLKHEIIHPIVNELRQEAGFQPLTLAGLVPELKLLVCEHLDVRSLVSLSKVSLEFQKVCSDNLLWRKLFLRDFGSTSSSTGSDWNWKSMYQREHIKKLKKPQIVQPEYQPTPFFPPAFPEPAGISDLDPTYPIPGAPGGGMIGGAYDLQPELPYAPFLGYFNNPRRPPYSHHPRRGREDGGLQPHRPRFDPLGPIPDAHLPPGGGRGLRVGGRHPDLVHPSEFGSLVGDEGEFGGFGGAGLMDPRFAGRRGGRRGPPGFGSGGGFGGGGFGGFGGGGNLFM